MPTISEIACLLGSEVTGDAVITTPVSLGTDEPGSVSYARNRAALKGRALPSLLIAPHGIEVHPGVPPTRDPSPPPPVPRMIRRFLFDTVDLILEKLGNGETVDSILESHPRLTREGVLPALRAQH